MIDVEIFRISKKGPAFFLIIYSLLCFIGYNSKVKIKLMIFMKNARLFFSSGNDLKLIDIEAIIVFLLTVRCL